MGYDTDRNIAKHSIAVMIIEWEWLYYKQLFHGFVLQNKVLQITVQIPICYTNLMIALNADCEISISNLTEYINTYLYSTGYQLFEK